MILGLTKRMVLVDAETSSECDLKKHGSDRYWADSSTRCLMLGFQEFGTEDAYLYQPHLHNLPRLLVEAAALPPEECLFAAYNANFDRHAMALAGIPTPAAKWFDIMLAAYTLAFSGGLNDVLKQFEVRGRDGRLVQKHPEGARLIGEFSKQQKPWYDSPTDWDLFARYCVQDVEVEALLLEKCLGLLDQSHFHAQMQTLQGQWLQDQAMNARGMPISIATVKGALAIKETENKRLTARLRALTGLANPNSTQQMHGWLTQQGATLPELQAATVREALDNPDLPPRVREVLGMRLELSKASVKKYDAFERMEVGGRIRNCYTTSGASRTGRTASRGVNLSNLERPKLSSEIADSTCKLIEIGDPDLLTAWTPSKLSVMEILGACVRGAIAAPPGMAFAVADLKSIESVGVAWLAGCDTILDLFHKGLDGYKDLATRYYGVAYGDVTSEQRTFCKPVVLGCIAGETLTLTQRGWVHLDSITISDKLWDGVEWVTHGGLLHKGTKGVLSHFGIQATPDHVFMTESGWREWGDILDERLPLERSSVPGLYATPHRTYRATYAGAWGAALRGWWQRIRYAAARRAGVSDVPRSVTHRPALSPFFSGYQRTSARAWSRVSESRWRAVLTRRINPSTITVGEASRCVSSLRKSMYGTLLRCLAGITPSWKSTELATTDTIAGATYDSPLTVNRRVIDATPYSYSTPESDGLRQSSGRRLRLSILPIIRFSRKSVQERPPNRFSLPMKSSRTRTYDVKNCGPRNRFVVWSDIGPLIAHNCGYGASGTALVDYAAGMNITMRVDDADRAVTTFRESFWEIPLFWRNVEDAAKRAIKQPGTTHKACACDTMAEWGPTYKSWPYCSFYYNGTFLYAGLPSGRTLFYYKPEIKRVQRTSRKTGNNYWAENINYWGKRQESGGAWSFISTHGGMLVENLTQALCRDVLYNGLRLLEPHKNIEIVGTTYDEIIALSSVGTSIQTLGTLIDCMTTLPEWADSRFFLGADGYHTAKRYRK